MADERTRLIGVSHVPTSGGLVQPVAEIGKIARACGALYLLDATQSVGQFPLDAAAIGCDMLTGTGRKFLRGPRGTGFLWVRTAALERLDPFVAEIGSATWDGHGGFTWAQAPAVSGPGSTATSTSWAWARPCGKPSTWAWPRSPSAPSRWAPGFATSSASCRASPPMTWARPAAPSSRPRSQPARRRSRGRPAACRAQRQHHRARAQPARHAGPRRPSPDPVLPALLQHRRRDRPRHRAPSGPGQITGTPPPLGPAAGTHAAWPGSAVDCCPGDLADHESTKLKLSNHSIL